MLARPTRYAIERPVEYRLRESSGAILGEGRTLNISRRGVLFRTEHELQVGSKIDLLVRMGPTSDETEINLYIQGVTVRSEHGKTAVMIKKHKLKSAKPEK